MQLFQVLKTYRDQYQFHIFSKLICRDLRSYISWSSGDIWKPYGKLNIEHAVYRLGDNPHPNIDWFMVKAVTEGVPGKVAWGEESYLEDFWNYYYLKHYN